MRGSFLPIDEGIDYTYTYINNERESMSNIICHDEKFTYAVEFKLEIKATPRTGLIKYIGIPVEALTSTAGEWFSYSIGETRRKQEAAELPEAWVKAQGRLLAALQFSASELKQEFDTTLAAGQAEQKPHVSIPALLSTGLTAEQELASMYPIGDEPKFSLTDTDKRNIAAGMGLPVEYVYPEVPMVDRTYADADFNTMTRDELVDMIAVTGMPIEVNDSKSRDDLQDAVEAELATNGVDLNTLGKLELIAFISEHDLDVTVEPYMGDDEIRAAILAKLTRTY